jgi:hypothetical protein
VATVEEVRAALDAIYSDIHSQFESEDRLHETRLSQVDSALATARMAIEHLYDEEIRHRQVPKAHAKATGTYVPEDA